MILGHIKDNKLAIEVMGMFITLEGVEGSGKTTVARRLVKILEDNGYDVLSTREPGGNKIAESIRDVVLDTSNTDMDVRTEALLYAAARRQHLVDVIEPALKAKRLVICDRFVDSSIAYQGYARKIGPELVEDINDFAIAGKRPDVTFLINIKPEIGLKRISKDQDREVNRLDLEELEFHQLVYDGYQELAKKYSNRIIVIDGKRQVASIVSDIYQIIKSRITL